MHKLKKFAPIILLVFMWFFTPGILRAQDSVYSKSFDLGIPMGMFFVLLFMLIFSIYLFFRKNTGLFLGSFVGGFVGLILGLADMIFAWGLVGVSIFFTLIYTFSRVDTFSEGYVFILISSWLIVGYILGLFVAFLFKKSYSKKQKIIALLTFVTLCLFLYGVVPLFKDYEDNMFKQRQYLSDEGLPINTLSNSEAYPLGPDGLQWKIPESITKCKFIFNLKYKNECIIASALTQNDVKICDFIKKTSSSYYYKSDKERCRMLIAIKNNDLDTCRNLEYFEGGCLFGIALQKNDLKLCGSNLNCFVNIAALRKDTSLCARLEELDGINEVRSCYATLAREFLDPEICQRGEIFCDSSNESCLRGCDFTFGVIAKTKKDKSICSLIREKSYREFCVSLVDAVLRYNQEE